MGLDNQSNNGEYLSLADAAREFGLSQDYLRFLIFKKKLKAEKIGRNWVTRKEWILEQRRGVNAPTTGFQPSVAEKHLSNPQLITSTPSSPLNLDRLDSWAKRTLRRDSQEKRRNGIVDNRLLRNFFRLCKNKTVAFALSLVVFSAGLTFVDASPNTLYAVAEKAAARLAAVPRIVEAGEDFFVGLESPTFSEIAELAGDVFNRAKTVSFSDVKHLVAAGIVSLEQVAEAGAGTISETPAAIGDFILEYRPPTPRQFAENLRQDLRDIFQKAKAPSPKSAVTALRDIFEKAADGLFGLVQPETELGTRNLEPGGENTEPGAKSEELSIAPQPVPSSSNPVPSSIEPAPIREITKEVTQITERREIVVPADTTSFQRKLDDINSYVLTQFSKVFGDLTLLSSRIDTKTPFTVFAQSTKIDQLIGPTVKDGMTIATGNLNITDGYIAATSAIISGTTDIRSNLTVGGTLIVSGAQTFSGALTLPSFTATSTTATSSIAYGFIAADKGGLVGIGTSTPFAKLSVAGLGTGNNTYAFAVSDSASTTRFVITDSGNVGIGIAGPDAKLTVSNNTSAPQAAIAGTVAHFAQSDGTIARVILDGYGASTNPVFSGRRTNGTAASPTALVNGDVIAVYNGFGYGATSYSSGGRGGMSIVANENWSDTAQGTYIGLFTTADGTTSQTEKMRIGSSGSIGVGTTSPGSMLSVKGPGLFNSTTTIEGGGLIVDGGIFSTSTLGFYTASAAAPRVQIDTNGNVGIGTTGPQALLSVDAPAGQYSFMVGSSTGSHFIIDEKGRVAIGTTTSDRVFAVQTSSAGAKFFTNNLGEDGTTQLIIGEGASSNHSAFLRYQYKAAGSIISLFHFGDSLPSQGLTVFKGGAVGVGTVAPSSRLEVKGVGTGVGQTFAVVNSASTTLVQVLDNGGVGISTTSPGSLFSVNGSILAQTGTSTFGGLISPSVFSTTSLAFYTSSNAAARLLIDTNGNVGIGTTGPGSLFAVKGPGLFNSTTTIEGGGLITGGIMATGTLGFYTAGTAAPRAVIDSSGNVGIGTTGPSSLLSVVGTAYLTGTAGSNIFTVGSTTTQFLIDPVGRVGIATSSPLGRLTVEMDANTYPAFVVGNNGSSTPAFYIGGVNQDGNVGIGTSSTTEKLTLKGGSFFQAGGDNNNTYTPTTISGAEIGVAVGSNNLGQNGIYVSGSYAYILTATLTGTCTPSTGNGCEFRIYNISTSTPTYVSGAELGAQGNSVFVSGNYAYVGSANTSNSFSVYDISDPTNPKLVTNKNLVSSTTVLSVYVSGSYLYVGLTTVNGSDFRIFDVSDPRNPIELGGTEFPGSVSAIAVQGNYAYIGGNANLADGNDFQIIDISDPRNPVVVGGKQLSGSVWDVKVSGSYAYVGKEPAGTTEDFIIYNISNPASIATTSSIDTGAGGYTTTVNISGRYAYIGTNNANNLRVIDVGNPYSITTVGGVNLGGYVFASFVQGKKIYIGTQALAGDEFRVYDISGIEAQSVLAHSLEAGEIKVRNDVTASGRLFSNSVNAGSGGIFSGGPLTVSFASTTQIAPYSASFMGGSVGVGTSSPPARLTVTGRGTATDWSFLVTDSASTTRFLIRDNGTVGIGTDTPGALFSINNGSAVIGGVLTAENNIKTSFFVATSTSVNSGIGTTTPGSLFSVNGSVLAQTGTSTFGGLISPSVFSTTSLAFYTSSNAVPRLLIDTSGRVGIGTTGPSALLSLNGPFLAQGTSTILGGGLNLESLQATGTLAFYTSGTAAPRAVIDSSGNFGIGTTGPSALFSVAGTAYFNTTAGSNALTVGSSTTQFVIDGIGRIGIATSSPLGRLTVEMDGNTYPSFVVANNGSSTPAFTIGGVNQDGRIGIGTSSPAEKFTLIGGSLLQVGGDSVNNYTLKRIGAAEAGGSIGGAGWRYPIFVDGNYAYVGVAGAVSGNCNSSDRSGCEFKIYDVSTSTPSLIGGAELGSEVQAVYVTGGVAYVGHSSSTPVGPEFFIYDVSSPTTPVLMGSLRNGTHGASNDTVLGIQVIGRYAYVFFSRAIGGRDLNILDVIDPRRPVKVGTAINCGGNSQTSFFVQGRYAYITGGGQCPDFSVFDISNPANPVVVSTLDAGQSLGSIYVSGSYAYVTGGNNNLIIYNISNPSSIATTSNTTIVGGVSQVYSSGNYLYMAVSTNGSNEVVVVDVSNPSHPVVVGGADTSPQSAGAILSSGKRLYVGLSGASAEEFLIYDLTGIETQSLLAHSFEAGQARVRDNLSIGQGVYSSSLNTGLGGIQSTGPLSVFIASTTQVSPVSASFMGGSVGVGTSSPPARLSVTGRGTATDWSFLVTDSASTTRFLVRDNGTVGVGTDTPGALLSVNNGSAVIGGILTAENSIKTSFFVATSTSSFSGIGTTTPGFLFSVNGSILAQTGTSTFGGIISPSLFSTTSLAFYTSSNAAARLLIDTNGNIGVGTTGPSGLFNVSGGTTNPLVLFNQTSAGDLLTLQDGGVTAFTVKEDTSGVGGIVGIGTTTPGGLLSIRNRDNRASPALLINQTGGADHIVVDGDASLGAAVNVFKVQYGGNVGVGTSSPGGFLSVSNPNNRAGPAFLINQTGAGDSLILQDSGTTVFKVMDGGNVGIGTSSPFQELSVGGDIMLQLNEAATTNGICHSGADVDAASSAGVVLVACSAAPGDIAEWYETEQGTESGDIVATSLNTLSYQTPQVDARTGTLSTDITQTVSVLKKASNSSDSILGIVSTAPYQTFGRAIISSSQNPQPVALAGRVPVKVSLEGGSIQPGDKITLSSQPGIGMKATTSGNTVGIALEPFDGTIQSGLGTSEYSKTGKILVFVNLGYSQLDSMVAESTTNNQQPATNAWSVDQQSGKVSVNFFGDLRLNGNSIVDVKAITGMWGKWSIDENGKVIAKEVETEVLTVKENATFGSIEKRIGITIYDEDTGEPYCLKMKGGVMKSEAGACLSTNNLPLATEQTSISTTTETTSAAVDTVQSTSVTSASAAASAEGFGEPTKTTADTSSETPASAETATQPSSATTAGTAAGETAGTVQPSSETTADASQPSPGATAGTASTTQTTIDTTTSVAEPEATTTAAAI